MEALVRSRNRRGEGTRLGLDILDAAVDLLEETGREDAITLRAVARHIGISAPSIYAHFSDREAITAAVVDRAFGDLIGEVDQSLVDVTDPVDRLRSGCAAYLRFAHTWPHVYAIMFRQPQSAGQGSKVDVESNERIDTGAESSTPSGPTTGHNRGADAFQVLVDAVAACVTAGRSASTDPYADATALWVALHGYATLRSGMPSLPWPGHADVFDRLVLGLARVTD